MTSEVDLAAFISQDGRVKHGLKILCCSPRLTLSKGVGPTAPLQNIRLRADTS